jgi:hypothetical protein
MRAITFLIVSSLVLFSCKKKDPEPTPTPDSYISMTIQPVFGNGNLFLDSIYTTAEGYQVKFTDIKCYLSGIGNDTVQLSQAVLFDYRETGTLLMRKIGDYTKFSSLQGSIGVISSLNHNDPSAFPNDSPLNISNAGPMHWGWNPGYIFLIIEGKVDTIADANPLFDHSFSFHIGTDAYLQAFNFSNLSWLNPSANEYVLPLKLNLSQFLQNNGQNIDLKTEFLTHTASGQELLTQKVVQNFKQSLSPY